MSFLDNISKKIAEGVDRAKFEAEKLQRTVALQNELGELRRQLDGKRLEFGDRALDLYKAGKIQSPTLGELLRLMEAIQVSITLKEEELKIAQGVGYTEPPAGASPPPAQSVPVSVEPPRQAPPSYSSPPPSYTPPPPTPQARPGSAPGTKICPTCSFQMPSTAVFCPNCGLRLGS
jgi:hypothetical protein